MPRFFSAASDAMRGCRRHAPTPRHIFADFDYADVFDADAISRRQADDDCRAARFSRPLASSPPRLMPAPAATTPFRLMVITPVITR